MQGFRYDFCYDKALIILQNREHVVIKTKRRKNKSRIGMKSVACAAVVMLCACSSPDTPETSTDTTKTTNTQKSIKDGNAPQFKHSKIALPETFPTDIPLPADMQLEKYVENPEDDAAYLEGLLAGKTADFSQALHDKLLLEGWKANLVIPQNDNQTILMHYTKDARQVIVELKQSVDNVVIYSINYELPKKSNTQASKPIEQSKESKAAQEAKAAK